MTLIRRARAALQAGDYVLAINLYERAMVEQPALAHIYQQSLDLIHRRYGATPQGSLRRAAEEPSWPMPKPSAHSTQVAGGLMLNELYQQVAIALQAAPTADTSIVPPLVSVLMTAHNVAAYVEQAVVSVLRQSHTRLELLVVDDASTDGTYATLQRLADADPRLRLLRLNTNLGTYFAKNCAVQHAQGEYVFFQDADDISHPQRLRLLLPYLQSPTAVAVCGTYSRVQFPAGVVLPINGTYKKQGRITLGLNRRVFDDIGYFNCTTKASDEEFFQRLCTFYTQPGAIQQSDLPLYYSAYRPGSLFADMVAVEPANQNLGITQELSPSRAAYVAAFERTHRELTPQGFKAHFTYPVLRDLVPVAPDMTRLTNPALPVVAAMCSIPEREQALARTLASLLGQVDELYLYLDRYTYVPACVQNQPKIKLLWAKDAPGLRDNAKFLPLQQWHQQQRECYYFTADDDILYPPDYVHSLIRKVEHYGRQAVVGLHGVLLPAQPEGYFSAYRKVHLFDKALEQDALVNNLGTGTVAFHSSLLQGLDVHHFEQAGMVDLYVSVWCKQHGIPMVAIARHTGWLQDLLPPGPRLHDEFKHADAPQTALVRHHAPWGYAPIQQAIVSVQQRHPNPEIAQRLEALLPPLAACWE